MFDGVWRMSQINCYLDESAGAREIYSMLVPEVTSVQFSFSGRNFVYSAQLQTPSCQVNANGLYGVDYKTQEDGLVSLFSVTSNSCSASLDEQNNVAVGVNVPFGVNEVQAQSLSWELVGNTLEVRLPLSFRGSGEAGGCGFSCICYGELTQNL